MKSGFVRLLCFWLCLCVFSSLAKPESNRVKIEVVGSYPELRVDSHPFFIHSAAFFYSRLPRDQWENSLRRHLELGINTLDLYLQWNWHEPQEGQLDFDGHSNPRRDLKLLLQMISKLGFKLIIRPGPVILNEWKNGGYPDWLLLRPEYQESLQDVLEGRYPRLSGLSTTRSDEASRQWLENKTHLQYTRKWYFDVMKVLSPYLASHGGNILFFQLDDDQAINRTNYNGPNFWRYMDTLRRDLEEAAVSVDGQPDDIIPFINPTDMRVSAAGFNPNFAKPIAAMGQWYMNSSHPLSFEDETNLQFFVEELKTQPRFLPMIIEFQAGWYVPGDDTGAPRTDPENTLLASRTLFAHGLRGLNYFPIQDTLYPAGYEVPWTNHYYTWEAALDVNANKQPRNISVHRNGNLIRGMGSLLAQTHKQAEVGIVYSLGALQPQEKLAKEDIRRISAQTISLQQYCLLNHVSNEYLDPEYQPLEQLQRHKILLMPVFNFEPDRGLFLSSTAEDRLVEFVEKGGTLVFFPKAPASGRLAEWFSGVKKSAIQNLGQAVVSFRTKDAPRVTPRGEFELYELPGEELEVGRPFTVFAQFLGKENRSVIGFERRVGLGRTIVLGFDFYSGAAKKAETAGVAEPIRINGENVAGYNPQEKDAALSLNSVMNELIARAPVPRAMHWSTDKNASDTGEIAVELATADNCSGFGFVHLVNFSLQFPRDIKIAVDGRAACLDPVELPPVHLPVKDALVLPLHLPLKYFIPALTQEEIVAASAELVQVEGDAAHFQLGFYSPVESEFYFKVADPSRWQFRIGKDVLKATVNSRGGWLSVAIPANESSVPVRLIDVEQSGAASPQRTRQVTNNTQDHSQPKIFEFAARTEKTGIQFNLRAGFSLPIREDLSMPLSLPILVLDGSGPARLLLDVKNPTPRVERYSIDIRVSGYRLTPSMKKIEIRPFSIMEYEFGLYLFVKGELDPQSKIARGRFRLKSRHETVEKDFLMVTIDRGTAVAFAEDLDRDGFPEVILENSELRLIVTPQAGARSFALLDKRSHKNLFTSVGAFRDKFLFSEYSPTRTLPRQIRGYFGLHNRPYQFEIIASGGNTAIARFFYDAPDVAPSGALVQKTITLHGSEAYFEVEYQVTPRLVLKDILQGFISSNSVDKNYLDGVSAMRLEPIGSTAQQIDQVEKISREYSGEFSLFFKPFEEGRSDYSYRVRYRLPIEP